MRRIKFRRTAAALLALCLMLSMTPGVLADEETATQTETSEKILTRGTWQNAEVVGADEKVSFVLDVYNSSFTADQIWLAVNVPEENQAIQLRFSDNAKGLYAYVYSA